METHLELLVRILGARGRERNERDRENDRNCAEHCFLPCFWRGDAALARLKNSAISGEFLLLRSMCSHMRDGEVCVRIRSTVHAKRSTQAAIGNPGANWTVVGAADFNGDATLNLPNPGAAWQSVNGHPFATG
jgi:hypothetical protein